MAIFAIADLHLPGQNDKEMNVFGVHWNRHFDAIQKNWRMLVQPEDIMLIPGDISWAMHSTHVLEDLSSIAALPGRKILLRGNHDYWWSSVAKIRALLPKQMYVLQNDALLLDGQVFCGTRGWNFPTSQSPLAEQDEKIYQRERIRLKISLDAATALQSERPWIVLMHFPPLLADGVETEFSKQLEQYPVQTVVYGHLHGAGIKSGFVGYRNGIDYHLTSCDALQFVPQQVSE